MPLEPVGLIGPALAALILVYDFIQGIVDAPSEARQIKERICALTNIISLVRDSYKNSSWVLPQNLVEQLRDVTQSCCNTADAMSKKLRESTTPAGRCKWVFKHNETKRHLNQLSAYFDAFRALQVAIVE